MEISVGVDKWDDGGTIDNESEEVDDTKSIGLDNVWVELDNVWLELDDVWVELDDVWVELGDDEMSHNCVFMTV